MRFAVSRNLSNPPSVVTQGLLLWLDATNLNSYSGSGTTWRDMSGNGRNGTLTNGPTYDSANRGSIVFDGTNDNISFGSDTLVSTIAPFSAYIWMNHNPRTSGSLFHRMATLKSSGSQPFGIAFVNGVNVFNYSGLYLTAASDWVKGSTNYFPPVNTWGMLTVTYNGNGSTTASNFKVYWNETDVGFSSLGTESTGSLTNATFLGARQTNDGNPSQNYLGKLSTFLLYNRHHNINHIRQNFNALRGRYGI